MIKKQKSDKHKNPKTGKEDIRQIIKWNYYCHLNEIK